MDFDSDDFIDVPAVTVEHCPPPKPKNKKNKPPKDLNEGEVPTAYQIRYAKDGTKWHSIVDILRPHSPPVEWPEYPDRPLEDDFSTDFDFDQISDFEDDPVKELRKLGIDEKIIQSKVKKFKKKYGKKLKEWEEQLAQEDKESESDSPSVKKGESKFVPEVPELLDRDVSDDLSDVMDSVRLHPTPGLGEGVTSHLTDGYNPPSGAKSKDQDDGFGDINMASNGLFGTGKVNVRQWNFVEDSDDSRSGITNTDRAHMFRELNDL